MDARAHLDSYRESLKKDALDGCIDYSMKIQTANPQKFPTVYDYLKYTLDAARYHAEADDPNSYKQWLQKHQEAMILLFERMVAEVMFDADVITVDMVLALIDELGWNWYKFGSRPITYKMTLEDLSPLDVTVVPRYTSKWTRSRKPGEVIFDADELSSVLSYKDKALARQVTDHKKEERVTIEKFLGLHLLDHVSTPLYRSLDQVNGDRVRDWALPLF